VTALLVDVEAELRSMLELGRPSAALWNDWPAIANFADQSPQELAGILSTALAAESRQATGASVEGDAVAFGMIDPGGRQLKGDARFQQWVGDAADSVDLRELAREASARGRASGRVRTLCHGVLATIALGERSTSPWPDLAQLSGLTLKDKSVLLVVFAPSRSAAVIGRAAEALDFSPLQRHVTEALLNAPSLDAAAMSLGVGRETARDALEGALQKAGVRRASQFFGRLIDLSCQLTDRPANHGALAAASLGLTGAESGVAERIAGGDTVAEAGTALRFKPGTVKAYRRTIFDKLGINRSRDLQRLITEAGELDRLSTLTEVDRHQPIEGELRILNGTSGRTVALIDHGPAEGRPLLLMHGFWTGRLAPPPLPAALRRAGRRVIVPQRPGFGLTSPAARLGGHGGGSQATMDRPQGIQPLLAISAHCAIA
jgi:DNA-binding CsgD family transcriptional regulator